MTTQLSALDHDQLPTRQRPGVLSWLWYSIGGRLDHRHSAWVLHDVTCRTWLLRHLARTMLIIVPILTAYLVLMPTSLDIRLLTGLTFTGGLFLFSLVNALIDTDRRAVRAGYGVGRPGQLRAAQSEARQRLSSHQRRERIAARRARPFDR